MAQVGVIHCIVKACNFKWGEMTFRRYCATMAPPFGEVAILEFVRTQGMILIDYPLNAFDNTRILGYEILDLAWRYGNGVGCAGQDLCCRK